MRDLADLQERLIQSTRDLILIQSTDGRPEERARCFQWIRNHLEETASLEIRMEECEGYQSLLAMPENVAHPDILLSAHLDVVEHPQPDSYRSEIRDGRIIGPGAGDMKGALAILLELLRNLHLEYPGISVGLAVTSDEERGGEHGLRYLVEETGLRCGLGIVPDGGTLNDVIVEEKGIMHLRLEVPGISAHAARPWLGDNPLDRLNDGLRALSERFGELQKSHVPKNGDGPHWFPTCTVTVIETENESPNRIPEHASAIIDVRFIPPHHSADALKIIRDTLGTAIEVKPIVLAEPTHLAPDPRFLEATEEVTGKPAHLVQASGGSDARFLCAHGIPIMLSRPEVGNLHGEDEWINISSMVDYYQICWRYILRVLRPD